MADEPTNADVGLGHCAHCEHWAIARYGRDQVALCLDHLETVMAEQNKLMRRFVRLFNE